MAQTEAPLAPVQQQPSAVPAQQRAATTGLKILAIVGELIGLGGAALSALAIFGASAFMSENSSVISNALGLLLALGLVVTCHGVYTLKQWGRVGCISVCAAYALLAVITSAITLNNTAQQGSHHGLVAPSSAFVPVAVLIGLTVSLAYPVIAVWVLVRKSTAAQFNNRS